MANIVQPLNSNPRAIQAASGGWAEYAGNVQPRMIVSTQAMDKSGKTHFGLTAPGPTALINMDQGLEGVIDKFTRRGKKVFVKDFRIDPFKQMQPQDWDPIWYGVRDSYLWAVSCGHFRTVFCDTGQHMWELQRLEAFGKLSQVPPLKYAEVNQQFEAMIQFAYNYPVNVIFSHRKKKQFAKGSDGRESWNGGYENTGYKDIGYVVQVAIQQAWHPAFNGPWMQIERCRQNMTVSGRELIGPECNFTGLGMLVYPGTTAANWNDGTGNGE